MKLRGRVVSGLGIGKILGYPTANLDCVGAVYPMPGVYAARAMVEGSVHHAVAVVGAREHEGKPLIEVLLFDFQGDLYGKEIEIEVLDKISAIQKFENKKALVKKIENDVKKAQAYFAQ